jgi:hypothetical protein
MSDPDVPFTEVAQMIDAAARLVDISIVTPSISNQVKWPNNFCLVATLPN